MKFKKMFIFMMMALVFTSCEAGFEDMVDDANMGKAALKSVIVKNAGEDVGFQFKKGVTSQTVNTGADVTSVDVEPTPFDKNSVMVSRIDGGSWSSPVLSGTAIPVTGITDTTKTLEIKVTSEDGEAVVIYNFKVSSTQTFASIVYNGNGNTSGTVPSDGNQYAIGSLVTVKSSWSNTTGNLVKAENPSISTSKAYRCAGWSDGTTTYLEGDSFTINSSSVTLTAVWQEYQIGDEGPGGGMIFYISATYQADPVNSTLYGYWKYMEAAPADRGTPAWWESDNPDIPGTNPKDIGSGYSNTKAIMDTAGAGTYAGAAKACWGVLINSYSDWFLPSALELRAMIDNIANTEEKRVANGFSLGHPGYWSSSQRTEYTPQACRIRL